MTDFLPKYCISCMSHVDRETYTAEFSFLPGFVFNFCLGEKSANGCYSSCIDDPKDVSKFLNAACYKCVVLQDLKTNKFSH